MGLITHIRAGRRDQARVGLPQWAMDSVRAADIHVVPAEMADGADVVLLPTVVRQHLDTIEL